MFDSLAFLQEVDLGHYVLQAGQLIASADPWLLGIAVSLFVGVGHKLAVGNRLVYGWGLRLAALSFLAYFGTAVWQAGGIDQVNTSTTLARSAIVGGCVLSLIWILLPVILFVYGNFAFGLAGFAGYVGYALLTAESIEAEAFPAIAVRGALVAGLAMVLAWILRPVWEFASAVWLANRPTPVVAPALVAGPPIMAAPVMVAAPVLPPPPAETVAETAPVTKPEPRLSRLERRQRRLARLQALQAEFMPNSPVLTETAQALSPPAQPQETDSRRRRDKARLEVELAYLLALPQLGNNFPRPLFDGWVVRYLGNQLPAEEVEENSWHMQKALRQYHPHPDGSHANLNLEELHVWFLDEQRRIQALHVEPAARQAKLLALQELYVSLSQRFVGGTPNAVVQMLRPEPEENLALPEAIGFP